MRFRYYACSIIWIYWVLIIVVVCLRPVRLLGGRTNLAAIQSELAHRPASIATDYDDEYYADDEYRATIVNTNNNNNININVNVVNDDVQRTEKLTRDLLDLFEKQLLTKMGMNNRPRPKRKIVIPDKLRELYNQLTTSNAYDVDVNGVRVRDTFNPIWDSARSFFPEPDDDAAEEASTNVLTFNLSSLPSRERIEGADLALLLERNGGGEAEEEASSTASATSATYLRLSISDTIRNHTVLMDTAQLKCDGGGNVGDDRWVTFDVSSAVRRWLFSQTKTGRLQIDVVRSRTNVDVDADERYCGVHLRRNNNCATSSSSSRAPVLIVYTSDVGWKENNSNNSRRTKRNVHSSRTPTTSVVSTSSTSTTTTKHKKKGGGKHRQKTNRRTELCRRRELHIDFESVGWNDWIVAPSGYDAYYCSGECVYPLPDFLNATNHAIVQTLVHSVNPGAAPKSCCVPTELGPISMLYLDEFDKVVLKTYQEMVVVGCGCR